MKIKALTRSLDAHQAVRKGDAPNESHNLDPSLHPFSKSREYTRAVNAAKLDRMHAKPFVAALEGHVDGVYCLAKDPNRIGVIGSGSGDGEIRLWDMPTQTLMTTYPRAHHGIISSLIISPLNFAQQYAAEGSTAESSSRSGGRRLLSCSTDRTIKLWDADPRRDRFGPGFGDESDEEEDDLQKERAGITGGGNGSSSGGGALREMTWGAESINVVRFNPSEKEVLAGAGSDRGIVLYDLRSGKPLTRTVMKMRANDIAWSPIEPTVFAVASEDHNMYTFDMRNMTNALQIYKDHVSAVMSVDWSPTGQDLVTGSYDRTVRLWNTGKGNHSRDTYHTSRMQRVFAAAYTLDARFVCSASDDGNVRLWKSRASEKLGIQSGKERAQREYRQQLVNRWRNVGDVGKIDRQRRVPKAIKTAQKLKHTMLEAERTKEDRRRKHSKAGQSKPKAARKDTILAQQE